MTKQEYELLQQNFDNAMKCIEEVVKIARRQNNREVTEPIVKFLKEEYRSV